MVRSLVGHDWIVFALAYSPADSSGNFFLASGSVGASNNLLLWNNQQTFPIRNLTGHTDLCVSVTFITKSMLASASYEKLIIFNTDTGESTQSISITDYVAMACSSNYILAVSLKSGYISLYKADVTNKNITLLNEIYAHTTHVYELSFSSLNYLASRSSMDFKIWNPSTNYNTTTITKSFSDIVISSFAFSSSNILALSFYNADLALLNPDTGETIKTLPIAIGSVTQPMLVAFNANNMLAVAKGSVLSIWVV